MVVGRAAAVDVRVRGQAFDLTPLAQCRRRGTLRSQTLIEPSLTDAPDPSAACRIEPAAPSARRSRQAQVRLGQRASVTVGGDAPVRVQSMTNTDTVDAIGTADPGQGTGAAPAPEMVRITVNTPEAAGAGARTSANSWTAWASTCRWSATSTTTATRC